MAPQTVDVDSALDIGALFAREKAAAPVAKHIAPEKAICRCMMRMRDVQPRGLCGNPHVRELIRYLHGVFHEKCKHDVWVRL